jgi:hypothetical protein
MDLYCYLMYLADIFLDYHLHFSKDYNSITICLIVIMLSLFEEAEGWEFIRSVKGSPSTTVHILRRYTAQKSI